MLLQRDSAFAELTSLIPQAGAYKSTKSANDPDNGRVDLTYTLTAYESYNVYGEEAVYLLKNAGTSGPGRREVVFYDLLPYGVKFDPSKPVNASRITDVNYSQGSYILTKDKTQVELTVDPETDVIPDYKGTGRTLVKFHLDYTGTDPSVYADYTVEEEGVKEEIRLWLSGWQVSFGAYYDWKDISLCNPLRISRPSSPRTAMPRFLAPKRKLWRITGRSTRRI